MNGQKYHRVPLIASITGDVSMRPPVPIHYSIVASAMPTDATRRRSMKPR